MTNDYNELFDKYHGVKGGHWEVDSVPNGWENTGSVPRFASAWKPLAVSF